MFNDDMRKRLCEENEFPAIKSSDFAKGVDYVIDLHMEIYGKYYAEYILSQKQIAEMEMVIKDRNHEAFWMLDYYLSEYIEDLQYESYHSCIDIKPCKIAI